ncbi:MAG: phenylalanine--tRNA ligase subunit alpha [Actinobacteria bacterium]|nr:phenylalanine--tRNA ligase subunit alpha [Actinomycetota bacterium]
MDASDALRILDEEEGRGAQAFRAATTLDELEAAQVTVLGRKAPFSEVQRALGAMSEEDRRSLGKAVNETRSALEAALAGRRAELEGEAETALLEADLVDLTLPGRRLREGSLHPLTLVENEIVDVFMRLGFTVVEGPEVEDDWHNFQALNIPPDHPARTMKDSIYPSVPGRPDLVLRTETSAAQIRTMQSQEPPVYVVHPGRVYRRETPDATHLPVFHQVECLAVDEGITFADLKGTLEAMARALFGEGRRVRLAPSFFPFVEPGAQVEVSCFKCDGVGCVVCGNGWIEMLGAGMVHPVVLENCGYDSERYTGFAFGMGIERVALLRYGIPDMRLLVDTDARVLAQFGAVA